MLVNGTPDVNWILISLLEFLLHFFVPKDVNRRSVSDIFPGCYFIHATYLVEPEYLYTLVVDFSDMNGYSCGERASIPCCPACRTSLIATRF